MNAQSVAPINQLMREARPEVLAQPQVPIEPMAQTAEFMQQITRTFTDIASAIQNGAALTDEQIEKKKQLHLFERDADIAKEVHRAEIRRGTLLMASHLKKEGIEAESKAKQEQIEAESKAKQEQIEAESKAKQEQIEAERKAKQEQIEAESKAKHKQVEAENKAIKEKLELTRIMEIEKAERMKTQQEEEIKMMRDKAKLELEIQIQKNEAELKFQRQLRELNEQQQQPVPPVAASKSRAKKAQNNEPVQPTEAPPVQSGARQSRQKKAPAKPRVKRTVVPAADGGAAPNEPSHSKQTTKKNKATPNSPRQPNSYLSKRMKTTYQAPLGPVDMELESLKGPVSVSRIIKHLFKDQFDALPGGQRKKLTEQIQAKVIDEVGETPTSNLKCKGTEFMYHNECLREIYDIVKETYEEFVKAE